MLKKKIIVFSLAMSMLPTVGVLANDTDSEIYIDLSENADIFLDTKVNVKKSYIDGSYYFNGENYPQIIERDNISYKLYDDSEAMTGKVDDVVKVSEADVEIPLNSSPSKAVGLIVLARGIQENDTVKVKLKYENEAVEEYSVDIFDITQQGEESEGTTALEVIKSGLTYKAAEVEDKTVYLHDYVIELSESVNKSSDLKSIILPAADFTYYAAAVTQVSYTEAELEAITQENINKLYTKYEAADFKQVAGGENGLTLSEAKELKQSLISQLGKMEEATEENIEKISLLIEGAQLYLSVTEYKNGISEGESKYLEISPDFDDLSQTSLTDDDYKALEKLIEMYDKYTALDIERLYEIAEHYDVEINADVDVSNKNKIEKLYNAYSKAVLKDEFRGKIEQYYDSYIEKDISEITSDDEDELIFMLEAFEEAKANGIEFDEYDSKYIKHLYNDYEKYQTSEKGYAVDISKSYNADTIGNAGESVNPDTWFECSDNISGAKFLKAGYHNNISSYDAQSGTLFVKEYEYTQNTDSSYKFTATGYNIPFIMPQNVFSGSVCDTVLLKANSDTRYTVNMNNVYTDTLYILMSGEESNVSADILYNDGTQETVTFKMNKTSQLAGKVSNKEYENLVSYITAGDYSEYGKSSDNLIYKVSDKVTIGLGVLAVEPDSQKGVASVSINSTTKNTAVYGISVMPEKNDAVLEYAENLYNEVVTDDGINTSDKSKTSALTLVYDECKRRGLYSSVINADVVAELKDMVLSATGSVYREDGQSAKAEIYFSVPVDKESAKEALTVTVNGDTKNDYTVSFDEASKIMTVDVPVGKEKVQSLNIKIDDTVKLANYPDITMMYPFETEAVIEAYITAEYNNGTVKMINSSKASQDYIVYVQAADKENVYSVNVAEGTLNGLKEENLQMLLSAYPEGAEVSVGVLDKNSLALLCEVTAIHVCDENTVNDALYTEPSFDLKTNTLKINGFTPSLKENKVVSVIVSSKEVVYCGTLKTNKDGYFCFEIPFNSEAVSSGKLEIKLGSDDFEKCIINDSMSFSDDTSRKTLVNGVKNAQTKSEAELLLADAKDVLSISFAPFEYVMKDAALAEKLADRILKSGAEIEAVEDSDASEVIGEKANNLQRLIKQHSVLVCIENNAKSMFSDGSSLLYNELMGYSKIDSDGVTLYKLFNEGVSEKGKAQIINAVSSKKFDDCDALCDELKKAIMLNALIYPSSKGVGYVKNVLTKENADAVDIVITKYLSLKDKSEASAHIANMTITSLKDVTDYISKLGTEKPVTGGGGGSSAGVGVAPGNASWKNTEDNSDDANNTANNQSKFSDLPVTHWGYNQVTALNEKGIINGYGDGSFGTDKIITRAEFIKLVCLVKGIEAVEYEDIFEDVNENDWYAPYVIAAYKSGIVNGISDTEFGAGVPVSRQDICVMLYRSDDIQSDIIPQFNDSEEISDYAKEAIGYFSQNGIVNGFDGNVFKPHDKASRVQAAAIIYNYMNK